MTNDESRLTKRTRYVLFDIRHSVIPSSFAIRQSSFSLRRAFTLIELIVVIAVIIILAGLVLSTVGYVQKKGARSRAETEIAAMSAACESYKADNGIYPRDNTTNQYTDTLDARQHFDATQTVYQNASLYLYDALFGATSGSRTPNTGARSYFTFKPNQLSPSDQAQPVAFIRDPFGNSYGYSTANQADPVTPKGYNPTFDLWSTANSTDPNQWIKNW
jgi:prepilin-type N-terminal cleavage/methylation domain-containing protein